MKILLVSFYFPPFNAIGAVRTGKLAKELIAHGHEVRVLTAAQQRVPETLPQEIDEALVTRTGWWNINGLPMAAFGWQQRRYRRSEVAPSSKFAKFAQIYRTFFNFPDGQIGWYWRAVRAGRCLIEAWRPDLIYASAPPFTGLMVACRLAREAKLPWIGELRDLWTDNYYADWPAWRRAFETPLERRVLASAAGLVTVSEPLADRLRDKYRRPVAVVPNGFDPDDYRDAGGPAQADLLRIVYTGTVYPGRQDPSPLFAAVKSLGEAGRRVRIEFYGRTLPGVRQLAERHGIEDQVSVHAEVPFHQSARLQAGADVLLLLLWNSVSEPGVFTGKLFEYLGARRPVLAVGLATGVATELIRDRAAGFASDDVAELAARLRQWLAEKDAVGAIAALPETARAGLSRRERFAALFDQLAQWLADLQTTGRRRRIAVVVPQLAIGGTERHLIDVLPKLDRRRFAVTVVSLRGAGPLDAEMRQSGIPVVYARSARRRRFRLLAAALGVARYLRRERPDIVHFFLPEAYLVGGLCAVLLGGRGLVMSRRSLNRYQSRHLFSAPIEHWLHRRMGAILANSAAITRELAEEGVRPDQLHKIYTGIETGSFADVDRRAARRELALTDEALVFICVANLIPYKGHRNLLAAFAAAAPQLPDGWRLLLIGRDNGIGASLREHAQELGLDPNLRWLGEQTDVANLLSASDIAVLASHEEGLPKIILEAMAAGLACVVTDAGGTPEAVLDRVTGRVVPVHDTDAFAQALVELAGDQQKREQFGRAAKQRVDQLFRLEACVREYEKVYEGLLDGTEAISAADAQATLGASELDPSA